MREGGEAVGPVHKVLLTKVTSGSPINSEHTHVTPINIVDAKENIPGPQIQGGRVGGGRQAWKELEKKACDSDLNTSDCGKKERKKENSMWSDEFPLWR